MPPSVHGLSDEERLRRAALCVKDALQRRSPMMHELSALQVQVFTLLESKALHLVTCCWVSEVCLAVMEPCDIVSSTRSLVPGICGVDFRGDGDDLLGARELTGRGLN